MIPNFALDRSRSPLPTVALALSVLLSTLLLASCSVDEPITERDVLEATVQYMMARKHGGAPFEDRLYPDINPVMFDPRDESIYFALRPEDCGTRELQEKRMEPYVHRLDDLQWSRTRRDSSGFYVGEFHGRFSDESGCACRTPMDNLAIDTGRALSFPYKAGVFRVSLRDLAVGLRDQHVWGGPRVVGEERRGMARYRFHNHGALVSRPGDFRLDEFTRQILAGTGSSREDRIQGLLDFVSTEIVYDDYEARGKREILKRSAESLISGKTDCGNKSILFASMLEQIGEEYLLVYTEEHLAVAVPAGDFPIRNDHHFEFEETSWVICETTVPEFRIGIDPLHDYPDFEDVRYVQRPSEERGMIDPHSRTVVGGM